MFTLSRLGARPILGFAALAIAGSTARADTLQVPGDSSSIQGAILLAADGDTILVAPGTYVETIDFSGKQIVVESTGGAAVTTIDAQGGGTTVTADSEESEGTALRGFTVTGGSGRPTSIAQEIAGGGIYVGQDAHLEVTDCRVTGNVLLAAQPTLGGGIYADRAWLGVHDCELAANSANQGAALYSRNTHELSVSGCDVSGNTATVATGSIRASVYLDGGSFGSVTDCIVHDNNGTGLHKYNYFADVEQCTFYGNTLYGYSHNASGGSDVIGLTFLGNGVAGAYCYSAGMLPYDLVVGSVFKNDTLKISNGFPARVENSSFDGAVINHGGIPVRYLNAIVRGTALVGNGVVTGTYSDVEGGLAGVGNIDADPQWADAANGDYHLLAGSPCIDTGDPASAPDPDGSRADMGALPFENTWVDLGGGVAGVAGVPVLGGTGTLAAGSPLSLTLSGAPAFKPTTLFVGAAPLGASFKGGMFWPQLQLVVPGIVTNGSGGWVLSSTWPTGLPSSFSFWSQVWFPDAGAAAGVAGSNGLRGNAP